MNLEETRINISARIFPGLGTHPLHGIPKNWRVLSSQRGMGGAYLFKLSCSGELDATLEFDSKFGLVLWRNFHQENGEIFPGTCPWNN